jgi:hypothetical protein
MLESHHRHARLAWSPPGATWRRRRATPLIAAAKCGASHPGMRRATCPVCHNLFTLQALHDSGTGWCSQACVLHALVSTGVANQASNAVRPWGLQPWPLQSMKRRDEKAKEFMSSTKVGDSARVDSHEEWLELLAPDRGPRVQPFGHAAAARRARLPHRLKKELVRMLSVR